VPEVTLTTTMIEVVLDGQAMLVPVEVGIPGMTGGDGPPGQAGASYLQYPAAVALSGHRGVYIAADGVRYASNDAENARALAGVTLGAANAGESVQVQTSGEISEPSWTWIVEQPVYLGLNGALTQVPPSSGVQVVVGLAVAPTKLLVRIGDALWLS
jgi:hypothetical protein